MIGKKKLMRMEEEEHKAYHRRLAYVFIVIMITLFGGTSFYHIVEKWRYLDALYFSAYTITTVGYGDITPQTDFGKIFTILYMFAGVGIALYGISLMASHFVEVREEFWLERIGKIRISHPKTFFGKIRNLFNYESKKLTEGYGKSVIKKR